MACSLEFLRFNSALGDLTVLGACREAPLFREAGLRSALSLLSSLSGPRLEHSLSSVVREPMELLRLNSVDMPCCCGR
jgi:hypothetical protein